MLVLDKDLQEDNKMDVKIKLNQDKELEEKLPIDRVISVYNGITYLYDTQFEITEDMISEVING